MIEDKKDQLLNESILYPIKNIFFILQKENRVFITLKTKSHKAPILLDGDFFLFYLLFCF